MGSRASHAYRFPRATNGVALLNAPMKNPPESRIHSRAAFLERRIDALPAACRTVYMLCGVERVSVREAGVVLSLSANAVRSRYLRATRLIGASSGQELDQAFAFDGHRCERMIERVLSRLNRLREDEPD